jgi:hypothetical protein
MPAFVGLDVSQREAAVCFLLGDGGEPAPRWTVPNSQPGADALIARLAALAQTHAVPVLQVLVFLLNRVMHWFGVVNHAPAAE